MTIKEMQVTVVHLAKGQAPIAWKPSLLMVAIGSKPGSTTPPATPTRTYENPTPPGVAEVPSDPDAQRRSSSAYCTKSKEPPIRRKGGAEHE